MMKHNLYMKIVLTLMALCIFVGLSIILFYNNFALGFFVEFLALLILFIVVIWDS